MDVRSEVIRVREGNEVKEKEIKIYSTRHGPVVARKDGKAYAAAIPYMDQCGLMTELYGVFTAKNLDEVKKALEGVQLMPQNVMVGTVEGDIFYARVGRVPIRNHGLPTNKPVPGHETKNDYAGIHPLADLVQVTNPPSGYMQNCNISPEHMMRESPLVREKYAERPYLFNHEVGPAHQRAEMVTTILAEDDSITVDEALDLAFCTRVLGAEKWQARLAKAWEATPVGSARARHRLFMRVFRRGTVAATRIQWARCRFVRSSWAWAKSWLSPSKCLKA
jgi:acyl-homoserine lactone acylase PvdQ